MTLASRLAVPGRCPHGHGCSGCPLAARVSLDQLASHWAQTFPARPAMVQLDREFTSALGGSGDVHGSGSPRSMRDIAKLNALAVKKAMTL